MNSIGDIPEDLFKELENISEFKRVEAGTQIVKLNEVPTKVYLLLSGVIRCYLSTESGKEYNKSFYFPTSFMGALTALVKKQPSRFVFESISECELYEVDYLQLMELYKKNTTLKVFYSRVLEMVYMQYEKRLVDLISLDATQRYLELRKQNPNIDRLISQYHIASYLGITPVQLSRIRKKIGTN
ncbi:Crp/Fnr family transcriptional regulator [Tamlana crocina]|uniref:Crp/Fnr family transcriptional regulator n=1 Tax=Tamlana crocina TaxID=393006 RepID=A0ABX1DB26_9FLAO|nr:Crp/Fnr family transcriptional regulator [Tamlana crocina]NJX15557.1 Crp/Fnr family transcriptional regulator [Tamlana crocina]